METNTTEPLVEREKTNEKKISYENYEGTPFTIVDYEGIIMINAGPYRCGNKTFETVEKAKKYIDKKPWELIVTVATVIYETTVNESYRDMVISNKKKDKEA